MARLAGAEIVVALPPGDAQALWTDVDRWPTFIEGFGHVVRKSEEWPATGAKLVWESNPGGRGRVTERVSASAPGAFATEVLEERLHGIQALAFEAVEQGTRVTLRLEYGLTAGGPLAAITDLLFIRRAVRDALRRTLRRYAVEAQEEGGLR
jgi:Polyketide cyclase / dehydrase and lipid transport